MNTSSEWGVVCDCIAYASQNIAHAVVVRIVGISGEGEGGLQQHRTQLGAAHTAVRSLKVAEITVHTRAGLVSITVQMMVSEYAHVRVHAMHAAHIGVGLHAEAVLVFVVVEAGVEAAAAAAAAGLYCVFAQVCTGHPVADKGF